MRIGKIAHIGLLLLCGSFSGFTQEGHFSTSRNMQFINPSYHGINMVSKAGVYYSQFDFGDGTSYIDNKYLYGNFAFEDMDFSIGLDVNSFSLTNLGLTENKIDISYIYKIPINFDTYILGALTLGIGSDNIDRGALIFQDQIDLTLGTISGVSRDPLADFSPSTNYFDIGASALIYNERFLIGLSLDHINTPNVSFNNESNIEKEIAFSLQAALEFNVNQYGRSFLPDYSYMMMYLYAQQAGETLRVYSSQELQMDGFTLGILQSLAKFRDNNALEFGLTSGFSSENYRVDLTYTFPSSQTTYNPPSIVQIGVTMDFDRFSRNRRGNYKRLSTNNM
ncbi:MAG: type IX secretion system membrane protein PorP/SprF [Flavobacteriaceae bacterium]|nr:type IX secretion system membrane protein PorP/SprF [Flavobacteriaceae bacterium]